MKILKTVTKDQVHLLMDFNYNNVYGRIRYVLGKDAVLFSDIHIKNLEVLWIVRDDAEYVALSELPPEKVSMVKNLLCEKLSYVTSVLSGDSLIGEHVANITTYPSDEYVFVKESNSELNVVIAGWGCKSYAQDNKEVSHVEDCAEELSGEHISDNANMKSSNTSTVEQGAYNSSHVDNETSFSAKTNKEQQELVCPKCMTTYPAGSTFCPRDGERLTTSNNLAYYCEKCGTKYNSDTKFCPKDGGTVVCRIAGQHYSQ
ncbi:MAG: zinc ribbon domain-containing protein [Prevotellaceae bacterium]|nr:zinc ribbon domain-containing protein [Prevotellaceae bacterium]